MNDSELFVNYSPESCAGIIPSELYGPTHFFFFAEGWPKLSTALSASTMTDVPVIPSAGDSMGGASNYNEPPVPPQTAATPTSFGSDGGGRGAYGRLSGLRQSVDER